VRPPTQEGGLDECEEDECSDAAARRPHRSYLLKRAPTASLRKRTQRATDRESTAVRVGPSRACKARTKPCTGTGARSCETRCRVLLVLRPVAQPQASPGATGCPTDGQNSIPRTDVQGISVRILARSLEKAGSEDELMLARPGHQDLADPAGRGSTNGSSQAARLRTIRRADCQRPKRTAVLAGLPRAYGVIRPSYHAGPDHFNEIRSRSDRRGSAETLIEIATA